MAAMVGIDESNAVQEYLRKLPVIRDATNGLMRHRYLQTMVFV